MHGKQDTKHHKQKINYIMLFVSMTFLTNCFDNINWFLQMHVRFLNDQHNESCYSEK